MPSYTSHKRGLKPVETLADFLEQLRGSDPRCVVVARRISQFGFRSQSILHRHYSQYGPVIEVFAPHSRVGKASPAKQKEAQGETRTRPGNLALICMESCEDAAWILSLGELQNVAGHEIQVQLFEQKELGPNAMSQFDLPAHENPQAMLPNPQGNPAPTAGGLPAPEPMYLHIPVDWDNQVRANALDMPQMISPTPPWAPTSTFPEMSPQLQHATQGAVDRLLSQISPTPLVPTVPPGVHHQAPLQGNQALPAHDWKWGAQAPPNRAPVPAKSLDHVNLDQIRGFLEKSHTQEINSMSNQNATQVVGELQRLQQSLQRLELEWGNQISQLRDQISQTGQPMQSFQLNQVLSGFVNDDNQVLSRGNGRPDAVPQGPRSEMSPPNQLCRDYLLDPKNHDPADSNFSRQLTATSADSGLQDCQEQKMHDPADSNFKPTADTLRMHLISVKDEDADCIFVCRRISPLGFRSKEMLRQHYSSYGVVKDVYVANTRVKTLGPLGDKGGRRVKPGGLGIVVMASAEMVRWILAEGEQQEVFGHKILLRPFERPDLPMTPFERQASDDSQMSYPPGLADEFGNEIDIADTSDWSRQASTAASGGRSNCDGSGSGGSGSGSGGSSHRSAFHVREAHNPANVRQCGRIYGL